MTDVPANGPGIYKKKVSPCVHALTYTFVNDRLMSSLAGTPGNNHAIDVGAVPVCLNGGQQFVDQRVTCVRLLMCANQ